MAQWHRWLWLLALVPLSAVAHQQSALLAATPPATASSTADPLEHFTRYFVSASPVLETPAPSVTSAPSSPGTVTPGATATPTASPTSASPALTPGPTGTAVLACQAELPVQFEHPVTLTNGSLEVTVTNIHDGGDSVGGIFGRLVVKPEHRQTHHFLVVYVAARRRVGKISRFETTSVAVQDPEGRKPLYGGGCLAAQCAEGRSCARLRVKRKTLPFTSPLQYPMSWTGSSFTW